MKRFKKTSLLIAIAVISIFIIPTTAFAATGHEITSISISPSAVSLGGATADITLTIKNTGTDTITWVSCYYSLPSGVVTKEHNMMIPVGTSKTFTDSVAFTSTDLNQNISVLVGCQGVGWVNHTTSIKLTGEENVIRSDFVIEPEKDTYYVGDTVSITDTMRNSIGVDVTNLKMEYYLRRNGATAAGDTVDFGTVNPNQRVENTLEYTFEASDVGEIRIGSKVTYSASGTGPYTEYNVAHDFVVEPAPTPTETPTQQQTPTPEPTQAPVQEETATETPAATVEATASEENSEEQTEEESALAMAKDNTSVFEDSAVIITIIIVAGVLIALLLVLIIVAVSKKSK